MDDIPSLRAFRLGQVKFWNEKGLTELVTRAMNAVQNHFFGRCPPLTIGWECEGAEFVNLGVSNFGS